MHNSERADTQNTAEAAEPELTPFPIVGIGASAGGLAAATELFRNLSDTTGMAFVLVQHLDPNHESILAALLARHTKMPVTQATQGTRVEPNHIYVIPPNTRISIEGQTLLLTPRDGGSSRYLPIDHFLTSLAKSQKSRAIGIILSGTAFDGTVGLKEIKSAGGVTFAQDESAAFDSMPRNAVAAGAVDLVLSPEMIARELSTIAQHSHFESPGPAPAVSDSPPLRRILAMLRRSTNVDLTHYKTPTIQRRLSRRLALHNLEDLDSYIALLEEKPDELHRLFDDLLINVTEFFRDPATFQVLTDQVFPRLIAERVNDGPIRVWIPGCSSGEEAYSLAMCLAEYLESVGNRTGLQIFGTDISERSIQTARMGRYPAAIAEAVSRERLERFFTKTETGYQVGRAIRDDCIFSRQDVTRDSPFSRMDLISCRNLLIYLGPVLQKRVMGLFNYALTPHGYLVLGSSESPGEVAEHYETVDREHKVFRKSLHVPAAHVDLPVRSVSVQLSPQPASGERMDSVLDRLADQLLAHDYAPSGFIVDADYQVLKFRGAVGRYLAPAAGDATLDVLRLVKQDLSVPLGLALEEAGATRSPLRRDRLRIETETGSEEVNLIIRPLGETGVDRHFLVLFERAADARQGELSHAAGNSPETEASARELAAAREYMQGLVEELRSANEEAQSSNEELQSTNEELQTAKEELQSANEELTTMNDEMRGRNGELSQVNNDLLNLLSSMQTPIVMLNNELRIRRFTSSAEKVLNIIPTDVGRPISDLKPRINVPDLGQLLNNVISSLQPIEQEVQDQDDRWYSLRIRPYRTAENRIDGAVLQLLDVDQLKQSLAHVEEERDYSEAILSTVREPLVVLDHEHRIQTANRSFFETFKVSAAETLNSIIFEVGNGQWDFPKVRRMLDDILHDTGGAIQNVEIEHEFERIGPRTFELNARRLDSAGKPRLILLALEDISERKRAAEARYRRLFETAKDGICILDGETGQITDVNHYVIDHFGYKREELIGKEFWDAAFMDSLMDGPGILRSLQACEIFRREISARRKGTLPTDCEIIGNMYNEGEKRVIQFNIRDITERKQFDQKLQQTAKLESLGLLAGGIAHDFNNLLTGIMGNASLALAHAPVNSRYQRELTDVVDASHRAASLTRQMLAYAGKGRFLIRPVNLSGLVSEIGALVRTSIPQGVDLQLRLATDLPKFEADASQIQQVIMNLIINGAEAVPEGSAGRVTVVTERRTLDAGSLKENFMGADIRAGSFVALEVTDNGCGMDEETRLKMFDPFFTTKFTGRGLGLAAVQGIIRGHSGALSVRSERGQGTTVTVVFPAREEVATAPIAPPPLQDRTGSGLILVVDDEDIILRIAEPTLQSYGYSVITASNGAEAIDIVQERGHEIRLVILDLTMPVMGGQEAAKIIGKLCPDLPIILSSGYDQSQALSGTSQEHVKDFIQKPYAVERLLEVVKKALVK